MPEQRLIVYLALLAALGGLLITGSGSRAGRGTDEHPVGHAHVPPAPAEDEVAGP